MIFQKLDDNRFILISKKKYSKNDFLRMSRVKEGTYGEIFAAGLYEIFFENPINSYQEYLTYYLDEYKSFEEFLRWRYYLTDEVIEEIQTVDPNQAYIGISNHYPWDLDEERLFLNPIEDLLRQLEK